MPIDDNDNNTDAEAENQTLEERIELLRQLAEEGGRLHDIKEKIANLSEAELQQVKDVLSDEQDVVKAVDARLQKEKESVEVITKRLAALGEELKMLKSATDSGEVRRLQAEASLEAMQTAAKLRDKLVKQGVKEADIQQHIKDTLGGQLVAAMGDLKVLGERQAILQKVVRAQSQVTHQLQGGILAHKGVVEATVAWSAALSQGNKVLGKMLAMQTWAKLSDQVDSYTNKVIAGGKSLLFQLDTQTKSFQRQIQLGDEYTASIKEQFVANQEYGVSIEAAAQAQTVMTQVVTEFTTKTKAQRDALSDAALTASRLGVSLEDYGASVQASMKISGQSMEGAVITMGELAATARELGRDQGQFAGEYAKSAGQLAKFGDEAVNSFKELQRTAKITGMEMNKILNLTNKFDTFEDAAGMAGKLNAALGGNFVNAMDMMMETDPVARFESVRNAITDAGLSFDTMSYYQKQFYTESLGLGDVGDLAMMLSGNMGDLAGSTNKSAEELIAQKERAKGLVTMQEQLELIITKNSAHFLEFAETIAEVIKWVSESKLVLGGLVVAMFAFKVITIAATARQAWMTLQMGLTAKAVAEAATAQTAAAASLETLNTSTGRFSRTLGSETAMLEGSAGAHNLQAGAVRGNTVAVEQKLTAITAENQALRAEITTLQGNAAAHLEGAGATEISTVALHGSAAAHIEGAGATQAGTVATGNHTAAQATDTAATELNTVATTRSLKTDVLKIASSFRLAAANKAAAMAQGIETAATNGGVIAKGAMIVASGLATAANYAFGTSLVAASGGLLLIVPLVIGLVVGMVAMIKKFGFAKVALVAFGVGLVAATGGLILIIPAIMLAVKGIIWFVKNFSRMPEIIGEFVESILGSFSKIGEGIASGASALWEALISPFVLFAKWITSAWDWMLGKSISPFMASIIEGVKAGGQMLFDFLTWPYRMAWKSIKGIWNFFFGESTSPFMDSIIGGMKAGASAILDFISAPFEKAAALVTQVFDAISIEKTLAFGGFMAVLIGSVPFVAPAAVALAALAVSMGALALALVALQEAGTAPGLIALTSFADSMSLLTESVDELMGVADAFEHIAEAIDQIPTTKAVALSVLTTAMEGAAVSLAAAGPAAVAENIQSTIQTTKEVLLGGGGGAAPQNATFNGTLQLDAEATRRFLQGEAEVVVGKIGLEALRGG